MTEPRNTEQGVRNLELWIDDDSWAIENPEGGHVAGGPLSDVGQTRINLTENLRQAGHLVTEDRTDE